MTMLPEDVERWKFHPRWVAYELSTMGRIRSYWRNTGLGKWVVDYGRIPRIRSTSLGTRGHRFLLLIEQVEGGTNRQTCQIHGLVLETFVGPRPEGAQACHNNGVAGDNRLVNLRWDSHSANTVDSVLHGSHNFAILDADQVRNIWARLATGQSAAAIARHYRVNRGTITSIKLGDNWGHVTAELPPLPASVLHLGTGLLPDPIYATPDIRESRDEIWRAIPDFDGYRASTFGRFLSCYGRGGSGWIKSDQWRETRLTINQDGYYRISAVDDFGKHRTVLAHRLVLATFAGPCPPGFVGCHDDGDKTNNFIDNLRWDSLKANTRDHRRHTAAR